MPPAYDLYRSGSNVMVTQQVLHGDQAWAIQVRGEVVRYEQRKTGSWFAHAKDGKLWLDRLVLRKADGEIVVCNLGPYSRVESLNPGADAANNAHAGSSRVLADPAPSSRNPASASPTAGAAAGTSPSQRKAQDPTA